MIQVVGLRPHFNVRTNKFDTPTKFFGSKWRLDKFEDVFDPVKRSALLEKIPKNEHYNMYFTVADCFEDSERELKEQWAIPFDIDGVEFIDGVSPQETAGLVARVAATAIGVPASSLGIVFSGNGVHLYVLLNYAIQSKDFFDENREHYAAIAMRINAALKAEGLKGKADTSVFSHARIMRLPDTMNQKEGRPHRMAAVLNANMVPQAYYLPEQSGLADQAQNETVPDAVLRRHPTPDTETVLKECLFLQHCAKNPAQIDEPQWYASTSVTARLEKGRDITHTMSAGHPGYSYEETELKIDQALRAAGPRTCKDIDSRWGGCVKCPHFGKVTSPIMLRGPGYLKSKDFGFRKVIVSEKDGKPRPGAVEYPDLLKFFAQTFPYVCIEKARKVFIFNGKFWNEMSEDRIKSWMNEFVKHEPSGTEMNEFVTRLYATHVESIEWFTERSKFKMNFQNCTLDLKTMERHAHKPDDGFLNILSFDYDPLATAPRWKQFLHDSMAGDKEMIQLLEEFGGYALSGDPYPSWGEKYLVLYGDGENGKSIYLDVLSALAGRDSYSAVMAQDFENSNSRYNLYGKLFNKSEETSKGAFRESQVLKAMTGGGDITAERKYENQITFKNTAKIIMSVNDLPYNLDNSRGFIRRLFIVPFSVTFAPGDPKREPNLREKLYAQLPGICNALISAYRGAKANGRFVESVTISKYVNQYREETDIVFQFLDDRAIITAYDDIEHQVPKDEMFAAYVGYCRDSEVRPMSQVHFWRQARKHLSNMDERIHQSRSHGRRRMINGVQLLRQEM